MNYTSLKTISKILNLLGYLNLIIGATVSVVLIYSGLASGDFFISLSFTLLAALVTALVSLVCWGFSQSINLKIHNAQYIENINDNLYIIANIVEQSNLTIIPKDK